MPIEPFLWEWGSLLLRWTHVIAAIAWIGSSFYFVHLDLSLIKGDAEAEREGIVGEAWQVHGGGFYRMRKYGVAPPELPKELTWFKWESYATWASGFALLVWVYYAQASLYLTIPPCWPCRRRSPRRSAWRRWGLGWIVYDRLCKSPLGRSDLGLGIVGFAFLVAVASA
jgi:uncharacterized membrane protein